jgi:hypothetical protein
LAFPALRGNLVHRAILLGHWPTQSVFLDLFAFMPTSEPARTSFFSFGFNPWWIDPQLSVALFRPVSAVTHALDYALWPDQFVLQHVIYSTLGYGVSGSGLYIDSGELDGPKPVS